MFACECGKTYQHKQGLSRHKTRCLKNEIATIKAQHETEKEELKKQIDELKEKTAPKIFNNTQNIETQVNINYYGCENLEYISDKFIQEMMKIPYSSVPNIIKHIHFHPAHPENHNVKITNRKLPYASVYKNDKWELVQKKKTIEDLMQKGYGWMDDRIDNLDQLTEKGKQRYQAFQNKFEQDDPEAFKQIYQATELCLINGGSQ
jgi:glutaredoxin